VACPDESFQPDFFNNVAAVAIVLTFAKVVAHRSRDRESRTVEPSGWRTFYHALAVLAAVLAAGASLWATEKQSDWGLFHWCAWGGLIVAGLVFVGEILHDDVPAVKRRWQRLRRPFKKNSVST
jgi:hypothetical protein